MPIGGDYATGVQLYSAHDSKREPSPAVVEVVPGAVEAAGSAAVGGDETGGRGALTVDVGLRVRGGGGCCTRRSMS